MNILEISFLGVWIQEFISGQDSMWEVFTFTVHHSGYCVCIQPYTCSTKGINLGYEACSQTHGDWFTASYQQTKNLKALQLAANLRTFTRDLIGGARCNVDEQPMPIFYGDDNIFLFLKQWTCNNRIYPLIFMNKKYQHMVWYTKNPCMPHTKPIMTCLNQSKTGIWYHCADNDNSYDNECLPNVTICNS